MNILATLVLAFTPQVTTPAPQPNYAMYGSLSRQQTVYNNLAQQESERRLREYRKLREEARRQSYPYRERTVVYRQRPIVVRVVR